jgi:hypothetical protein
MARTTIRTEDITVNPYNADNLSSGSVPAGRLGNVPPNTGLMDDIALLAFKTQANGSLAKYNLVDQTSDAFEDSSGVDSGSSTNASRDTSGKYMSGTVAPNYYGDGSDGSLTTSGNVELSVTNTNGAYDADMLLKQYTDLTISAGNTFTVNQPCRGLFIYVSGNCTINGTLHMNNKGAAADPTASGGSDSSAVGASGLQLGLVTTGGSSSFTNDGSGFAGCGSVVKTALANQANLSSNGTIFTISRDGGAGDTGATGPDPGAGEMTRTSGAAGTAGATGATTISTGGGGSGATWQHAGNSQGTGGSGGKGGCFGGGSGGGGAISGSGSAVTGGAAADYGGAGGGGNKTNTLTNYNYGATGGAGNPGGVAVKFTGASGATTATPVDQGGGGNLWLIVKGNLTIGAAGKIQANGGDGGYIVSGDANRGADGGCSGGGAVFAFCAGTFSNSGTIEAEGGQGVNDDGQASHTTANGYGGKGADGGVHSGALLTGDSYTNMTLVSSSTTAQSAPTKGDIVMTYTNGAGTATLNTDLTAEYSADNGSTWTSMTLSNQGTTGGHEIVTAHDVSLTSTSGTSMRYRAKTLNQSISKQTRIQAVSLGWS